MGLLVVGAALMGLTGRTELMGLLVEGVARATRLGRRSGADGLLVVGAALRRRSAYRP